MQTVERFGAVSEGAGRQGNRERYKCYCYGDVCRPTMCRIQHTSRRRSPKSSYVNENKRRGNLTRKSVTNTTPFRCLLPVYRRPSPPFDLAPRHRNNVSCILIDPSFSNGLSNGALVSSQKSVKMLPLFPLHGGLGGFERAFCHR